MFSTLKSKFEVIFFFFPYPDYVLLPLVYATNKTYMYVINVN